MGQKEEWMKRGSNNWKEAGGKGGFTEDPDHCMIKCMHANVTIEMGISTEKKYPPEKNEKTVQ